MTALRYGLTVASLLTLLYVMQVAFGVSFDAPHWREEDGMQETVCPRPVVEATFTFDMVLGIGMTPGPTAVNGLAFTSNAKYLISSNTWGRIKLWDMLEREEWREGAFAKGMGGSRIAFAPEAEQFGLGYCGGEKSDLLIARLPSGKIVDRISFPAEISWLDCIALSRNGSTLAIFGGKEQNEKRPLRRLVLHDLIAQKTRFFQDIEEGAIAASFTPDGKLLGVLGAKGCLDMGWPHLSPYFLRLYDAENGHQRSTTIVSTNWASRLVFTSDSKKAAILCKEGIKIFNLSTGAKEMEFSSDELKIESFAFYPSSPFLFTGHSDGSIKIWSLEERKVFHTLKSHKKAVLALAFSRDGKWLASGGEDRKIKLWNCRPASR